MEEEIWKDIPGYEGYYQVSNFGNVMAMHYNKSGKPRLRIPRAYPTGYMYVNLWKNGKSKTFKIHRLVANAFIPNPLNLPQINHKDENKANNRVDNLEWCTSSYNHRYGNHSRKVLDGHKRSGSPKAEKPVVQIDKSGTIVAEFISISAAAREVGVRRESLRDCVLGKQHTCVGYYWKYKNS